jgi:hypothetical protein
VWLQGFCGCKGLEVSGITWVHGCCVYRVPGLRGLAGLRACGITCVAGIRWTSWSSRYVGLRGWWPCGTARITGLMGFTGSMGILGSQPHQGTASVILPSTAARTRARAGAAGGRACASGPRHFGTFISNFKFARARAFQIQSTRTSRAARPERDVMMTP